MSVNRLSELNDQLYRLSHMKSLAAAFGGKIQAGDETYTLAQLIEMEERIKIELSALRSSRDHLQYVPGKKVKK